MVICVYSYISQAKLYELLGNIKGVKKYINDILVPDKGRFYQHIDQLRFIFSIIITTGLTVSFPKCSFGLKNIP